MNLYDIYTSTVSTTLSASLLRNNYWMSIVSTDSTRLQDFYKISMSSTAFYDIYDLYGIFQSLLMHPVLVHAKAYGNTRLWSFPVDLGSNWQCLTLEQCMVMWQDGYGHADKHSTVLQTCPLSLSAAFWSGGLGATNETIFGTRGWT